MSVQNVQKNFSLCLINKHNENITNQTTDFAKAVLKDLLHKARPEQFEILQLFLQHQRTNVHCKFLSTYLQGSENTIPTQLGKPAACPDVTLKTLLFDCSLYATTHNKQDGILNVLGDVLSVSLAPFKDSRMQKHAYRR